ncbi:MAG: sigma-70 family RNA polymerase sigma factor [Acidobacteriota bacterium]|nr:sigma-70 family RNA polymerase sigma factor [Acidobacteriota bacterium]
MAEPLDRTAERARSATASDEANLIREAQHGNQDAFERLVRTYDQSVLRLAVNLLHSPDEARDVYQEAFLKVFRNLHRFRFDCSFHTWLYRIATNVCLDHLRRRKVRKEEPSVIETPEGPVDQATRLTEESPAGNPERQLWNRELSAGITAALESLTPRERTVFELRHYEGLRLRAIGEILGTSEEAAKNCLFRATQKMRASLETFV